MAFIGISFKNELTYRMSIIFDVLGNVFGVAVSLALWRYLYRNDQSMQAYMTQYIVLSSAISGFYNIRAGFVIGQKVLNGSIVTDMLRPSNLLAQVWFTELGKMFSSLLFRTVPTVLIFLPAFLTGSPLRNVLPAIIAVVFGHLLQGFMHTFIGYSAFILVEARPFLQIIGGIQRLFSGALIPLALFPGALGSIAHALPFRLLFSFPLTLLLGEPVKWGSAQFYDIMRNFALMTGWIALFYICTRVMRHFALRKFIVQGG